MPTNSSGDRRWIGRIAAAIVFCAAVVALIFGVVYPRWHQDGEAHERPASDDSHQGGLVAGEPETIQLTDEVVRRLGVKTEPVELSPQSDELKLDGYLSVDPVRLARVHARFAGEIVELAKHPGHAYEPGRGEEKSSTIRFGDEVKKDQLLAVIWSKDLGEKKSEFVDDYLQTALDRGTVERLEALYESGATAERSVREAQRRLETDVISQERAERTLRSWRLSDAEIESLRAEADTIRRTKQHDNETEKNWPRVEVRAPLDGRIVEMNIAPGDIIDTNLDLFKIGDMHQLRAMCNVYEEDMPRLLRIKPEERFWKIWTSASREGKPLRAPDGGATMFDQIGQTVDPNQHTALVMGWVGNPGERLMIGQFITAAIELPTATGEVAIPATAVIIDDSGGTLFVESKSSTAESPRYTRRRVLVARQGKDSVRIKMNPDKQQQAAGFERLRENEPVVTSGVLNLDAALDTLKSAAAEKK